MLLADRGYDADWIRALAAEQGAWANIPPKCNRKEPICFSPYLYRARNLVERFFNKIKQCRRVATRYDKLAANYLAFVQLASIRLWLRVKPSGERWIPVPLPPPVLLRPTFSADFQRAKKPNNHGLRAKPPNCDTPAETRNSLSRPVCLQTRGVRTKAQNSQQ